MAIRLSQSRGRPPHVAVPLGAGASIMLRPASYTEVQEAAARITTRLAGIVVGSAAAAALAPLLGPEFDIAELDEARLAAASDKLVLIDLIMTCQAGWSGIIGDDDKPIEKPDEALIGLLVRDVTTARRLRQYIEAPYNDEVAEGNG
jgi:hypothetical protein